MLVVNKKGTALFDTPYLYIDKVKNQNGVVLFEVKAVGYYGSELIESFNNEQDAKEYLLNIQYQENVYGK